MAKEYVFLDEWDVDAPQEAAFRALADARTYPEWWTPVYIEVEGDCEPAVGCKTRQRFKLLRYLTPILRPIFRWNHNWSATRAKEGLEPYARSKGS
ncbi:MAG: hypothetical protein ACRDL6_03125 [Solirubrobacterales bacterium]